MIRYYFTCHAEQRLKQRNIREEDIERVLNDPDSSYPGKQGELNLLKEFPDGKRLRVVVKHEKNRTKIITAIIVN
jgi:hypothetical protein